MQINYKKKIIFEANKKSDKKKKWSSCELRWIWLEKQVSVDFELDALVNYHFKQT